MKLNLFKTKKSLIAVLLLFVAGLLVGGYLVLESRSSKALDMEKFAKNIIKNDFVNDQDYDGLEDWEEKIYKTDPNNSDSDEDGYLDGEEVASGYDPTIPAPNDKLPKNESKGDRPDPGNLTEMFYYLMADKFKNNTFNLSKVDVLSAAEEINIDQETQEALQKATAGFRSNFIPPFQKENKVFKTVEKDDLIAISAYREKLIQSMDQVVVCSNKIIAKTSPERISAGIKIENASQLIDLGKCCYDNYQRIIQINPPLSWLDIHKQALSLFWKMSQVAKFLPEAQDDNLKQVIILKQIEQIADGFSEFAKQVQSEIEKK